MTARLGSGGRANTGPAVRPRARLTPGNEAAERPADGQVDAVEGALRQRGGQAGESQRRRQDILHHREGAARQPVHLSAQGQGMDG